MMQAVKISEKVYWVGAIDWNIRDFHGYSTKRGTTYNAYLVMGDTRHEGACTGQGAHWSVP